MSDTKKKNPEIEDREGNLGTEQESGEKDVQLARRMFIKTSWLIPPAVLASFTVSRPVFAATCSPNLCGPGDSCLPDICGPQICRPAP